MTFIEFIGFIVGLIGMFFLFFKQMRQDRQRQLHPELHDEEEGPQQRIIRGVLKSLEAEDEDDEEVVQPLRRSGPNDQTKKNTPPKPPLLNAGLKSKQQADKYYFESSMDHYRQTSPIETRSIKTSIRDPYSNKIEEDILSTAFRKGETAAYEVVNRQHPSRASLIIRNLPSSKNMVVIREIFGPPKSMQADPWQD